MEHKLTVKDILPLSPLSEIMVRVNSPFPDEEDGMLFGYCAWDGKKLISLDGDNYDLNDIVTRYEHDLDGNLTYWIHAEWK